MFIRSCNLFLLRAVASPSKLNSIYYSINVLYRFEKSANIPCHLSIGSAKNRICETVEQRRVNSVGKLFKIL